MIEEELFSQLFNKIPENAHIAIFGASELGEKILNDIHLKRKDVKVTCFIDNFKKGTFCNLPVYSLKNYTDISKDETVIVASISAQHIANNIFDIYDIPYIPVTKFILDYYCGKPSVLDDEIYYKTLNVFQKDEDKILFDKIFKVRKNILPDTVLREHFAKQYKNIYPVHRTYKNHYIEKINKEKVEVVFDLGFHDGVNAITYNRLLPNLKRIYAFEAIYEYCKYSPIEEFILNDKLIFIKAAVGENKGKTNFYVAVGHTYDSFADFDDNLSFGNRNDLKQITVDVITIDDFCSENNVTPDLIKTDIEGAEMPMLKSAIKTIQKCRPQLAISIYHSDEDFVNIPLFLAQNLENYIFKLGQYSPDVYETVLYAIPKEYEI